MFQAPTTESKQHSGSLRATPEPHREWQPRTWRSNPSNQATLRMLAARAPVTVRRNGIARPASRLTGGPESEVTGAYSQEADPATDQNFASGRSPAQATRFAFGKIAIFPKDQPQSRSGALRLPEQLQRKLVVGHVNDPLEHEADRVADTVLGMPVDGVKVSAAPPQISRKCAACDEDEDLQKKSAGTAESSVGEAPDLVREVLRSPGHPLDAATRAYFEPRFGYDFSRVRVHSDARAAESATQIDSLAYTVGNSIVFRSCGYAPDSGSGKRLLAHELTHVVQQGLGAVRPRDPVGNISVAPASPEVVRRAPSKGSDDPPSETVVPMEWVPYGSTPLSKKARDIRRGSKKSEHYNLVVFEYTWWRKDKPNRRYTRTRSIWNDPDVAHSEPRVDQYFRDLKEKARLNHSPIKFEVTGMFSERQYCVHCQQLVYKSHKGAKKEFAHNYQIPHFRREKGDPTERNRVAARIKKFRDDKTKEVDDSARNDPHHYDQSIGSRVAPRQKPAGDPAKPELKKRPWNYLSTDLDEGSIEPPDQTRPDIPLPGVASGATTGSAGNVPVPAQSKTNADIIRATTSVDARARARAAEFSPLFFEWQKLAPVQRQARIEQLINAHLASEGVPPVWVNRGEIAEIKAGEAKFKFHEWNLSRRGQV
jgi:hypothetical protein